MNVQHTTPASTGTAQDVRDIFDKLAAAAPETLMRLEPEDVFYTAYEGTMRRIESELAADPDYVASCIDDALPFPFVSIYGADGQEVRLRDHEDGWFDGLIAGVGERFRIHWQFSPNVVDRSGEYLLVSRGRWLPVAAEVIDGERTFEFITTRDALRREREREAAWQVDYRAEHPEVDAAKPRWATEVEIWNETVDGHYRIEYSRSFTLVTLQQLAVHRSGAVELLEDPSGYIAELNDATLEQMRTLAAELVAAAEALEA